MTPAGPATHDTTHRTGSALLGVGLLAVALVVALRILRDGVGAPAFVQPDWRRDFSPAEYAAAEHLQSQLRPAAVAILLVGVLVPAVLAWTPAGHRVVDAIVRRRDAPLAGPFLAVVAVLGITRLVTLGPSAWLEAQRQREGLSTRTWWSWALDLGRAFLVDVVVTAIVVVLIVALVRRFPRWWFASAAGLAAVTVVLGSMLYPLVVEPLFTRISVMPDSTLNTRLLALADTADVSVDQVLVAEASVRTSTLNAYVSGLGPSRRLVVYDTLLDSGLDDDAIAAVVAHELAHVSAHDVAWGTVLGSVWAAAAVSLAAATLTGQRVLRVSGAPRLGDVRAVPALCAGAAIVSLAVLPLQSAISRHVEQRADAVAVATTQDPAAVTRLQRTLAVRSMADLDPPTWARVLWGTHPTATERIADARSWAVDNDQPEPPDLTPRTATGR